MFDVNKQIKGKKEQFKSNTKKGNLGLSGN